jgi:ferredoxin
MTLIVKIDMSLCDAAGMCAKVAPQIFESEPFGKVIMDPIPDQMRPLVAIAVKQCPTFAITMTEE